MLTLFEPELTFGLVNPLGTEPFCTLGTSRILLQDEEVVLTESKFSIFYLSPCKYQSVAPINKMNAFCTISIGVCYRVLRVLVMSLRLFCFTVYLFINYCTTRKLPLRRMNPLDDAVLLVVFQHFSNVSPLVRVCIIYTAVLRPSCCVYKLVL